MAGAHLSGVMGKAKEQIRSDKRIGSLLETRKDSLTVSRVQKKKEIYSGVYIFLLSLFHLLFVYKGIKRNTFSPLARPFQ